VLVRPGDWPKLQTRADSILAGRSFQTEIEVRNETTFAAARRLIDRVGAGGVCALNFASAKNPGGISRRVAGAGRSARPRQRPARLPDAAHRVLRGESAHLLPALHRSSDRLAARSCLSRRRRSSAGGAVGPDPHHFSRPQRRRDRDERPGVAPPDRSHVSPADRAGARHRRRLRADRDRPRCLGLRRRAPFAMRSLLDLPPVRDLAQRIVSTNILVWIARRDI
jgi:hypothetical protein